MKSFKVLWGFINKSHTNNTKLTTTAGNESSVVFRSDKYALEFVSQASACAYCFVPCHITPSLSPKRQTLALLFQDV